jgi:hypothetical protein
VFTKSFRLDRRTVTALRTQSGNKNLLNLDHYFWIAGESHQRFLGAMLQHLCFQALQQYSALAEVAFPDEWVSRMSLRGLSWTTKTLVAALKRIITASGFQTCITIDGLDECEDKQRPELIQMLLDLAKTTPVRLCVSSRPWSDFEKAFRNWPRLKLPENNAWDIVQLICRRLEQANDSTFQDCVDNVRLFDVTCARSGRILRSKGKPALKKEDLNPPQRLIHDLCGKTDGNMLWITCVLDTVSRRLADGQSVAEVVGYIVDLPRDLADYYYELVYTRIHCTYRTGKVSECAMALKIISCVPNINQPEESRFELMWALQKSIGTDMGVAHDPEFFANHTSSETCELLNETIYQSVSAFVNSRCKDLMVTSRDGDQGSLSYQHRVIHDFLLSERMQLSLDIALPEHFRRPHFAFHLGLLLARQTYEHARRGGSWLSYLVQVSIERLYDNLQEYLSEPQGPLDRRAAQTCDEITTDLVELSADNDIYVEKRCLLPLTVHLARMQQSTSVSRIIRLGSQKSSNHTELVSVEVEEAKLPEGMIPQWPGNKPSKVRQVVSTSEQHSGVIDPTLGRAGPGYLPCLMTWWTAFLFFSAGINPEDDVGPVWSESRAATYVARAFLQAGASIEVEICVADGEIAAPSAPCFLTWMSRWSPG